MHMLPYGMCGKPYACGHVYLLYITLMHVSTNSHVSLQMTGKSHKYVTNSWAFSAGIWQKTGTQFIPLIPPYERTLPPRQEALMLKRQASADMFQRFWVFSHETEEDTKAMTI